MQDEICNIAYKMKKLLMQQKLSCEIDKIVENTL